MQEALARWSGGTAPASAQTPSADRYRKNRGNDMSSISGMHGTTRQMDSNDKKDLLQRLHAEHGLGRLDVVGRETVWQACDLLTGHGIMPAIDAIRTLIGRGNRGTINLQRRAWEQHTADQRAAHAAVPDLPARLAAQFKDVWIEACQLGREAAQGLRERLAAQQDRHATEVAELTRALTASEERVEMLEAAVEEMRAAAAAGKTEREASETRLRAALAIGEARAHDAERRRAAAEAECTALKEMFELLALRLQQAPQQPEVALQPDPRQ